MLDKMFEEGTSHRLCAAVRKGDSCNPASEGVDHGEDIFVAASFGERTYKVDGNNLKRTRGFHGSGLHNILGTGGFSFLAHKAGFDPAADIASHSLPPKTTLDGLEGLCFAIVSTKG